MADGDATVRKAVTFDEAWPILKECCIDRLTSYLEAEEVPDAQIFTADDYMRFYTLVYDVSGPPAYGQPQKLYDHYKMTFQDHIHSKVLPSFRGKENEDLLQELLRQWKKHMLMTKWLSKFFYYLNRYFIPLRKLPSLVTTSHLAFHDLVYSEINDQVRDTIVSMIDRERDNEQIDQSLVKQILDIYVELGELSLKYYEKDFEGAMINATAMFYSRKAIEWISSMSYKDYMLKVQECLKQEETRVSSYLKYSNKHKLFEVVEHELLTAHAAELEVMKFA